MKMDHHLLRSAIRRSFPKRLAVLLILALTISMAAVQAATPTISSLSPGSAQAGGPNFTLTVTGTNFQNGSVVVWSTSNLATTFVSSTQLTASVTGGNTAIAGVFSVTVVNPDGATSNAVAFPVVVPSTGLTITNASPLPSGTVGSPYSQTFAASGGQAPYHWGGSGTLPAGLGLDPNSGTLSGTPTAVGTSNFTIQVADSTGKTGSKPFTLTINAVPLTITTDTLFSGTTGLPYSQTLLASGGVPPYKWSAGQLPAGISLDATTGTLSGTPQATGSFNITVQVTDSAGTTASRNLALTVTAPKLTIVTGSPLPTGTVGAAYSQTLSAIGGTAPYSWSLASGTLPGLSVSATGVLSGTPTDSGSFTFTIGVQDSAATPQTGTKTFTLTINPGPLTITTLSQLPDGALGQPYSQTLTAAGGTPPYTWSATGLPDGLSIDPATGIISGSATAGGTFSFAVTVTDNTRATSTARLQLNISLPPLPAFTITGLPGTSNPTDQPKIQLTLASPYPATISGQLSLTFTSAVGGGDGTILFSTGSRTASFTIPAGSTSATTPLAIQIGTVAGTIQVTAQSITAPGQPAPIDITPTPAPSQTTKVAQAAPSIVSAKLSRTSNGFSIQVTGYSTAKEVTQAVFHFTAASGSTLQAGDVTVPVQPTFAQWFQNTSSTAFGSQFTFTQPFTVQGDPNAVIPGSVTLTNSLGSNTANITQ